MASVAAAPQHRSVGHRAAVAALRLTPGEGWTAVLLHAVIVLAAASTVQRADWAPDRAVLAIVSLGGLALGFGLGKLRAPDLLAHLLAFWSGVAVVVWLALDRLDAIPDRRERIRFFWAQTQEWYRQTVSRGGIDDEGLFVVVMALTIWLVAYTSAWALYRRHWLTTALVLPGIIAVVNLGYAPEAGMAPLLVYVAAACLLAARHHAYRREREWARTRTPCPARLPWRFLGAGANLALLVALLAWNLPLSARATIFDAAWVRLEPPVTAIEDRWQDWAGDLGGGRRSGGSYAAFNDSFRLGGQLDLADDPVVVLRRDDPRPTYLAGHRYNVYDGHGWRSDAAATFDEINDAGDRYSSEMTFRTGQPIPLSPQVWTERETVEGTLTVLRPKGDLLFAPDTVQAVDRETHVRLSWQRLDDEPYPVRTGQAQRVIPVDLQQLVALLAEGSFGAPGSAEPEQAPPPRDPDLAARIAEERADLAKRFLKTRWEIGRDGRATTLFVTGQVAVYDDVEAVSAKVPPAVDDTYAVTALASYADPADLRRAGTTYPTQIRERYLDLPTTVTARTEALARQLRADLDNPFDIAVAIQNHVRGAIAYDEGIDAPPADRDVVDYVLFDSRRGYCEYYASAMAVMLRTLDIPARVVGGYFPAPYDAGRGEYLYREKNAHLWVEVYFPAYGWLPFEPTASRDALSYGDRAADAAADATPEADPVSTPEPGTPEATPGVPPPPPVPPTADGTPFAGVPGPLGWAALGGGLLLAVAAVLAVGAWHWRFRCLSPAGGFYARVVRAGRWVGVTPSPATTPSEYADRLGRAVPTARRPARLVADLYNGELYAGRPPEPGAGRTARAAWADLRRALLRARLSRRAGTGGEGV